MATTATIPLRFQRVELDQKAGLSDAGRALLREARGPEPLLATLRDSGNPRDAVNALAMMLPHRQAVWWACLATRLIPDLPKRPQELAAVEAAEAWVQSVSPGDAESAGEVAETAGLDTAPGWVAMAAHWSGASIAPRGQQPVPPAAHLPGVATRTALLLLTFEDGLVGRLALGDLLDIGTALMNGDIGRQAQAALRERLSGS